MKLTIEVESTQVDEFVTEITTSSDVFRTTCCGYWAKGIELAGGDGKGWLVFDELSDFIPRERSALTLWKRGEKLPQGYYRFDRDLAIKAWIEGVKKWGVNWYHERDMTAWDYVIQMAIFGEVVYG